MKIINIECRGTAPLMINNPRLVNKFDPLARAIAALTSKRKRTEDDENEMQRLKFEASLYFDAKIGPFLPATNLLASVQKGAALSKQGKTIERGVIIVGEERLPIRYEGPRIVQDMWDDGRFVDIRPAVASGKTIPACRAIFPEWSVTASFGLDPSQLDEVDFLRHAVTAGRLMGVGTFRKRFGRFEVFVNGARITEAGKPENGGARAAS